MAIHIYSGEELPQSLQQQIKQGNLEAFGWSDASSEADFANRLAVYYVWLDEGQEDKTVIGYVGLHCLLDEATVNSVYVFPNQRGRGVGGELLEHVCLHLQTAGSITHITLEVRSQNEAAVRLYSSAGFKQLALRRQYYQNPPDDALVMQRLL